MHHKRGRAKNQRAGCLLCKPHKANGVKEERSRVARQLQDKIEDLVGDALTANDFMEYEACHWCLETQNGVDCSCGYRGCACILIGYTHYECRHCKANRTRPRSPLMFSLFYKKSA